MISATTTQKKNEMKRGNRGKGVFKVKREKRLTRSGGISAAFFRWEKDHGRAACDFQIYLHLFDIVIIIKLSRGLLEE